MFLLLVSLVRVPRSLHEHGGDRASLGDHAQVVNQVISLVFATMLFADVRVLPSVRVPWSDVWHSAIATALLFTIGKFATDT